MEKDMEKELSVSLFSADFLHIAEDMKKAESSCAASLHVDVMDGSFVELYGLNQNWLEAVRRVCTLDMDIHFMTQLSGCRISAFDFDYVRTMIIHLEAAAPGTISPYLSQIREMGKRAGLAISPETPAHSIAPWVDMVDEILVMTCEPGKRGSVYLPEMLSKVKALAKERSDRGGRYRIAVDGGIDKEKAAACMRAGADKLIIGRCFYQDPSLQELFRQ